MIARAQELVLELSWWGWSGQVCT